MAGKYQGTAARTQCEYRLALYVSCASHRLNLCIVKSGEILLVKTMMDKVKLVVDFFNNSPKRHQALETNIRGLLGSGTRQKKMIDVCRTRWVERISALSKFTEMYEPIMVSLQEIKNNVEGHWNVILATMLMGCLIHAATSSLSCLWLSQSIYLVTPKPLRKTCKESRMTLSKATMK